VSWSNPFEDPIDLPRGRQLVTLQDAADYILKLPKAEQDLKKWHLATSCLIQAAEGRGPLMHGRIGVLKARSSWPSLEELYGYGAARDWGLNLVADLREYRAGRRSAFAAVAAAGVRAIGRLSLDWLRQPRLQEARQAEQQPSASGCAPNGDDAREAVLRRLRPDAGLLACIDDATSRIQHAAFVPSESAFDNMRETFNARFGKPPLTLQYDKVMFVLQPNEFTRPLARKRVTLIDYPDGRLSIQYEGSDLPYSIFKFLPGNRRGAKPRRGFSMTAGKRPTNSRPRTRYIAAH
jgi:hypothetical protein